MRTQPCIVCGKQAEPHHWEHTRGAGGSDLGCISLSRDCHSEIEQIGRRAFLEKYWLGDAAAGERCLKNEQVRYLQEYIMQLEGQNEE